MIECSSCRVALQVLAERHLRQQPTIPPHASPGAINDGCLWPRAFCAFQGCDWSSENGGEEELEEHLRECHPGVLEPIVNLMLRADAPDALLSVYNAGISQVCRGQAPLAGASLDRTALRSLTHAMKGDKVQELVCWSCGCSHAYVEEVAAKGKIMWYKLLADDEDDNGLRFLGRPVEEVEELLGFNRYLAKYDRIDDEVKISDSEDFSNWHVRLPAPHNTALLCCPEASC